MFKGMIGLLSPQEVRKYNAVHLEVKEEKYCQRCDDRKQWLFRNSMIGSEMLCSSSDFHLCPLIRFLRDQCADLGGDLNPSNVRCVPCGQNNNFGGFDPHIGIILCADQLAQRSRKDVEDTLAHEMVHAYDYLRFKFDHDNLKHHACTEVRTLVLRKPPLRSS
jgi:mitochondrial inner membrane protease ATP23